MEITQKELINLLFLKPANDFEAGQNNILISFLKKSESLECNSTLVNIKKSFKDSGHADIYENLNERGLNDLRYFANHFDKNERLQMIRHLKALLGMGLRDAKDVVDCFADLV